MWNSKVWACPESVINASENKKGQVLRIHCVIHTSRGMHNHTNSSVTRRTESHDQTKVTKGNGADFFRTVHRMDICIKKTNYFQRSFWHWEILCETQRSKILHYYKSPFTKNIFICFIEISFWYITFTIFQKKFIPLGFHTRRSAGIFNWN